MKNRHLRGIKGFVFVVALAAGCSQGSGVVATDCSAGGEGCPPATCAGGVVAEGCVCALGSAPVSCFDGPGGTANVGVCSGGLRSCNAATGTWGECDGQVVPRSEACDGLDNDCDGEVDDGVTSACGQCIPNCHTTGADSGAFDLPPTDGVTVDGVGVDDDGDLVLDSTTVENNFLWVANDAEGTVSKVDTRSGREVARYASVTHGAVVDHTGGRSFPGWNTDENRNGSADNRPSRTAVDFHGNVWVGNRAHDFSGLQPTATKIANHIGDCKDRNGSGVIDTSRDVSGNGRIELDNAAEFFGEADECIAMTVVIGNAGGNMRGVAIARGVEPGDPGSAWLGMFEEQAFFQVDGRTGALLQRVPESGPIEGQPYGLAIDSQGVLWAPDGCCGAANLLSIDTTTAPATIRESLPVPRFSGDGSYGIVVDTKDRVWLGGWPHALLKQYNPTTRTFHEVRIPSFFGRYFTRGLGIDTRGNVWAAMHTEFPLSEAWVARIDADTLAVTGTWEMNANVSVGVGIDFAGDVWTVNQDDSSVSRLHIDEVTGEPIAHPVRARKKITRVFRRRSIRAGYVARHLNTGSIRVSRVLPARRLDDRIHRLIFLRARQDIDSSYK